MNSEKDTLCEMSREQLDCNLVDPRSFQITRNDEASYVVPFHGQCGETKREYNKLLTEGAKLANASDFSDDPEIHPNVNRAGKPKTKGIRDAEGS